MCNTPVEVQFTSAGCLNYPCRTPLVAIKSTAITDKLKELGITLRQSSGRCRSFSDAAHEAGRKAGDRASFGRPVSGDGGMLRLK